MAITLPAATVKVELEDMTLGLLCFDYAHSVLRNRRAAGRLRGYVEAVLDANPGLAAHGILLPRGLVIRLPQFSVEQQGKQTERLWD